MPLALIIWLVLIFIIAVCACPGFLTALFTILCISILGILMLWFLAKMSDKQVEKSNNEREKAIDEWEKEWGRKHPTRTNSYRLQR